MNKEISNILLEISAYLNMQDVAFKPRAYEKAAEAIGDLEEDVSAIYQRNGLKGLEDIPGVGKSIAEKIEEFIKTGKVRHHAELRKAMPVNLSELMAIEGLGPQKIKHLYEELGISNRSDLEKSLVKGEIKNLEGFGEKSEENIKKRLSFLKKSGARFILGEIAPFVEDLISKLSKVKGAEETVAAGSFRRRKETIGDVDILITSKDPKSVMDYFVKIKGVSEVISHGETKSSVRFENGLSADLRVVEPESYGAALMYFTGSKDHNVHLREIAIKKGLKLNEYGLWKGSRSVAGRTEEEAYKKLGLNYIEPELRENKGEVELSAKNKLPKLLKERDILGDLQIQTSWTDGASSIEEMAEAAVKLGREYILITDHTKRLTVANGLDAKRLREQMKAIDKLNKKYPNFKVLKGIECDILKNGDLDLDDDVLSELDIVGASVHSYFNLPQKDQTARIKRAMSNKHVDIIFHPTGRLINKREAYAVDMDEIIKFAKETKTVLEIDAYPERSDLDDEYIRRCVDAGVKMCIDSDAHNISHLGFIKYGVYQARRGWATKKDIINAWPLEKMLSFLK